MVFQSISPNKFRLFTLMIGLQGTFWINVAYICYYNPELLSWYWGVGGAVFCTGIMAPMCYFHASRYVCEIALTTKNTYRISSYTLLGLPQHFEVQKNKVGLKGDEEFMAPSPEKGAFWPLRIDGFKGFHLCDKQGVVFKPSILAKVLGYKPEKTPTLK